MDRHRVRLARVEPDVLDRLLVVGGRDRRGPGCGLRTACSTLECVLSLLVPESGVALPTVHLQRPDPRCDQDYVANPARSGAAGRTMLSNSFAFGGTNAVLALRTAA